MLCLTVYIFSYRSRNSAQSCYDHARRAEWEFHEAVLTMKQSVPGQFGPNSDEIQALGYKRKSLRKRNRRRNAEEVSANEEQ